MNRIQQRRLLFVGLFALGLVIATCFILFSLKQNINAFLTPHQLATTTIAKGYTIRLGGLVKKGSVVRDKEGLGVQFMVTDLKRDLLVRYVGILPDLFREGTGVVALGSLNSQGVFIAQEVLAKHDENYMPKNVYKALRENAA